MLCAGRLFNGFQRNGRPRNTVPRHVMFFTLKRPGRRFLEQAIPDTDSGINWVLGEFHCASILCIYTNLSHDSIAVMQESLHTQRRAHFESILKHRCALVDTH